MVSKLMKTLFQTNMYLHHDKYRKYSKSTQFFILYLASSSDYPHFLLSQGLIKGCHAHLSYLDTESWCLVFAYIIHTATDQNNHFVPYKITMKVMVVLLPFTQICHSLLCMKKHSFCILILITSVS